MYSPQVELWAAARVTIAAGVASFAWQSGKFLSVARTAAGKVTVTLQADQGVDPATARAVLLTLNDANGGMISEDLTAPSDTVILLESFSLAGADADRDFTIAILRKRP